MFNSSGHGMMVVCCFFFFSFLFSVCMSVRLSICVLFFFTAICSKACVCREGEWHREMCGYCGEGDGEGGEGENCGYAGSCL